MVDILDFIASQLGNLIGTPRTSAKGLLRLAIKDAYPDNSDINDLRLADYYIVFSTTLKARLDRVHMKDTNDMIAKLVAALKNNQSLLTMMRV